MIEAGRARPGVTAQPTLRTERCAGFRTLFLRATVLFSLLAPALGAIAPRSSAQETARAKALGQKLMCVCGCNQILTACNHVGCTYSHSMLKELDQGVARNESDDLTLQAFVQEYGPTVLAEPSTKGFNLAAWVVPVVLPIAAIFLVSAVVRRLRGRAILAPASGPNISPELLARARDEAGEDSNE
jgi:cytochrome c-type biogenesis protein CcmH